MCFLDGNILLLQIEKFNFSSIKGSVKNLKHELISIIKSLRDLELRLFNEQDMKIDHFFSFLKVNYKEFDNFNTAATSADGNCFYNSISLYLLGNEEFSYVLRLAVLFIIFENEQYFRNLINFSYGEQKLNDMVVSISTDKNWANEYEIHAMSIALNRPINVYSTNEKNRLFISHQYYGHEYQLKRSTISILHRLNHYAALVPLYLNIKHPETLGNQFIRFQLKNFKNYP